MECHETFALHDPSRTTPLGWSKPPPQYASTPVLLDFLSQADPELDSLDQRERAIRLQFQGTAKLLLEIKANNQSKRKLGERRSSLQD